MSIGRQRDTHKDHIVNISGFNQLENNEKLDLVAASHKLNYIIPSDKIQVYII